MFAHPVGAVGVDIVELWPIGGTLAHLAEFIARVDPVAVHVDSKRRGREQYEYSAPAVVTCGNPDERTLMKFGIHYQPNEGVAFWITLNRSLHPHIVRFSSSTADVQARLGPGKDTIEIPRAVRPPSDGGKHMFGLLWVWDTREEFDALPPFDLRFSISC